MPQAKYHHIFATLQERIETEACFGLVGTAGAVTAQVTGVMPDMDIDLNATLVVTLVWMVVGYAIFSVLFGAAGALVSRQEDVAGAVMPLTALCVLPFMASLVIS